MEVDLNLLKKMSAEYAEAKNVAIKGIYSFFILYHLSKQNFLYVEVFSFCEAKSVFSLSSIKATHLQ